MISLHVDNVERMAGAGDDSGLSLLSIGKRHITPYSAALIDTFRRRRRQRVVSFIRPRETHEYCQQVSEE